MMRLLHATDIHWFTPPHLTRLLNKRLIGAVNLYLAGRRHHFSTHVQSALVQAIVAAEPDAVVISGDLTATGLEAEFDLALDALDPVLRRFPTLIQRGNHDVYTQGAQRSQRLEQRFGPWLHGGPDDIARFDHGDLTILGLDPNRPALLASGRVPQAQLDALPTALAAVPADRSLALSLHYPLVDRKGAPYDGMEHGLRNARDLIAVLDASPRKPDLILHGHVHHGYRSSVTLGGRQVPTFDPGSGGYAWLPKQHRAACFNVYTLTPSAPVAVERFRFDGEAFAPEPGGAYASGR
jgi:3',5'-cyclic AMP phosphodiesterase CpdA